MIRKKLEKILEQHTVPKNEKEFDEEKKELESSTENKTDHGNFMKFAMSLKKDKKGGNEDVSIRK